MHPKEEVMIYHVLAFLLLFAYSLIGERNGLQQTPQSGEPVLVFRAGKGKVNLSEKSIE